MIKNTYPLVTAIFVAFLLLACISLTLKKHNGGLDTIDSVELYISKGYLIFDFGGRDGDYFIPFQELSYLDSNYISLLLKSRKSLNAYPVLFSSNCINPFEYKNVYSEKVFYKHLNKLDSFLIVPVEYHFVMEPPPHSIKEIRNIHIGENHVIFNIVAVNTFDYRMFPLVYQARLEELKSRSPSWPIKDERWEGGDK